MEYSYVYESSQRLARLLIMKLRLITGAKVNEQESFADSGSPLYRLYLVARASYDSSKSDPETELARVSYAAQRLLATMLDGYSPKKQDDGEFAFDSYREPPWFIDSLERAYTEAMTAVVLGVTPMSKNIFGELQAKR